MFRIIEISRFWVKIHVETHYTWMDHASGRINIIYKPIIHTHPSPGKLTPRSWLVERAFQLVLKK